MEGDGVAINHLKSIKRLKVYETATLSEKEKCLESLLDSLAAEMVGNLIPAFVFWKKCFTVLEHDIGSPNSSWIKCNSTMLKCFSFFATIIGNEEGSKLLLCFLGLVKACMDKSLRFMEDIRSPSSLKLLEKIVFVANVLLKSQEMWIAKMEDRMFPSLDDPLLGQMFNIFFIQIGNLFCNQLFDFEVDGRLIEDFVFVHGSLVLERSNDLDWETDSALFVSLPKKFKTAKIFICFLLIDCGVGSLNSLAPFLVDLCRFRQKPKPLDEKLQIFERKTKVYTTNNEDLLNNSLACIGVFFLEMVFCNGSFGGEFLNSFLAEILKNDQSSADLNLAECAIIALSRIENSPMKMKLRNQLSDWVNINIVPKYLSYESSTQFDNHDWLQFVSYFTLIDKAFSYQILFNMHQSPLNEVERTFIRKKFLSYLEADFDCFVESGFRNVILDIIDSLDGDLDIEIINLFIEKFSKFFDDIQFLDRMFLLMNDKSKNLAKQALGWISKIIFKNDFYPHSEYNLTILYKILASFLNICHNLNCADLLELFFCELEVILMALGGSSMQNVLCESSLFEISLDLIDRIEASEDVAYFQRILSCIGLCMMNNEKCSSCFSELNGYSLIFKKAEIFSLVFFVDSYMQMIVNNGVIVNLQGFSVVFSQCSFNMMQTFLVRFLELFSIEYNIIAFSYSDAYPMFLQQFMKYKDSSIFKDIFIAASAKKLTLSLFHDSLKYLVLGEAQTLHNFEYSIDALFEKNFFAFDGVHSKMTFHIGKNPSELEITLTLAIDLNKKDQTIICFGSQKTCLSVNLKRNSLFAKLTEDGKNDLFPIDEISHSQAVHLVIFLKHSNVGYELSVDYNGRHVVKEKLYSLEISESFAVCVGALQKSEYHQFIFENYFRGKIYSLSVMEKGGHRLTIQPEHISDSSIKSTALTCLQTVHPMPIEIKAIYYFLLKRFSADFENDFLLISLVENCVHSGDLLEIMHSFFDSHSSSRLSGNLLQAMLKRKHYFRNILNDLNLWTDCNESFKKSLIDDFMKSYQSYNPHPLLFVAEKTEDPEMIKQAFSKFVLKNNDLPLFLNSILRMKSAQACQICLSFIKQSFIKSDILPLCEKIYLLLAFLKRRNESLLNLALLIIKTLLGNDILTMKCLNLEIILFSDKCLVDVIEEKTTYYSLLQLALLNPIISVDFETACPLEENHLINPEIYWILILPNYKRFSPFIQEIILDDLRKMMYKYPEQFLNHTFLSLLFGIAENDHILTSFVVDCVFNTIILGLEAHTWELFALLYVQHSSIVHSILQEFIDFIASQLMENPDNTLLPILAQNIAHFIQIIKYNENREVFNDLPVVSSCQLNEEKRKLIIQKEELQQQTETKLLLDCIVKVKDIEERFAETTRQVWKEFPFYSVKSSFPLFSEISLHFNELRDSLAFKTPEKWRLSNIETSNRLRCLMDENREFETHRSAIRSRSDSQLMLLELDDLMISQLKLPSKESDSEIAELEEEPVLEAKSYTAKIVIFIYILPFSISFSADRKIMFKRQMNDTEEEIPSIVLNYFPKEEYFIDEVEEIHCRRHIHRNTSLELFMNSRTSLFISFENVKDRTAFYNQIISLKPQNLKIVEKQRFAENFRKSEIMTKWQRHEISNFEYLLALNSYSGRSFNDLNQYPIFPWILSNYESATLDLTNEHNYRDLSKPIGALNSNRLASYISRFNQLDDETPKFYYGTHYSCSAIVLYYLLRLEPFTTLNIQLQGGKFDHADRIFHSIQETFNNCLNSPTDVKELIPEFFYLPEILSNQNEFHLGIRQSGEKVDHVKLPRWAKNPHEFIRINRDALESDFVSENLHHWIDLIFGYKQRGEDAEKSFNLFYYTSYEGSIDFDKISDPLHRSSIEAQINNFGQTPCQLLFKPHPKRHSFNGMFRNALEQSSLYEFHLSFYHFKVQTTCNSIFLIHFNGSHSNPFSEFSNYEKLLLMEASGNWVIYEFGLCLNDPVPFTLEWIPNSNEDCFLSSELTSAVNAGLAYISPDFKFVFIAGFWDCLFRIYHLESKELYKRILALNCEHSGSVIKLAASEDHNYLVTLSSDGICSVFDSRKLLLLNQFRVCCREKCKSLAVSSHFNIIAIGTVDGKLFAVDLLSGRKRFIHECNHLISDIKITSLGILLAFSSSDSLTFASSVTLNNESRLKCALDFNIIGNILITKNGNYSVFISSCKELVVFNICDMVICRKIPLDFQPTCVAFSSNQHFIFIGNDCGSLSIIKL